MDSSFNAVAIADTQITLLQFKVIIAANCPEGTYRVYTEDLVLSDVNSNSVYENNASISLTITTPHDHQWSTNWTSDGTHHWHECTAEGCTLTAGTANSGKDGYAEHNWTAANCTTAKTCSIITPTQPGDSKPAEGNPSTGAVSSPVGYIAIGLAVVGALCLGAKKLTKKHED